jgi:hypothetical protein
MVPGKCDEFPPQRTLGGRFFSIFSKGLKDYTCRPPTGKKKLKTLCELRVFAVKIV